MSAETVTPVEPRTGMTDEEREAWEKLTPEEQLAKLRAAIRRGLDSGVSRDSMDQIWERIQARRADA